MRPAVLLFWSLWLAAGSSLAAPIRITAWELAPPGRPTAAASSLSEERLKESAASLQALDPDVIFLRGLPNQAAAERMIVCLRPSPYRLVICSSFATGQGADPGSRQMAILAKEPAFGFQAVDWAKVGISNLPGGFVFAGFRFGKEPVCLYGLEFEDAPGGTPQAPGGPLWVRQLDLCSKYLARHMSWVEQKLTNQSVGLVVAGQLRSSASQLAEANLGQLLEKREFRPLAQKVELDGRISSQGQVAYPVGLIEDALARNVRLVGLPRIHRSLRSERYPVTYALEVGPEAQKNPLAEGVAQTVVERLRTGGMSLRHVALGGAVALVILPVVWWVVWRRRREDEPEDKPVAAAGSGRPIFTVFKGGVPVPLESDLSRACQAAETDISLWQNRALKAEQQAEQATAIVRQGLVSHLADWMKQKLVVGLLTQRNVLLDSNHTGSVHLTELESRLRRIQAQFQERLRVQQQRIAELEHELAAKERIIQQLPQNRV